MNKSAASRIKQGFTVIEIMIVVFILGVLVAIAIPAIFRARINARATAFSSDIRTLAYAGESFAMETGLWVPDTSPGSWPTEMDGYIARSMFEAKTPLGGRWNFEEYDSGVTSAVGVDSPIYPDDHLQLVDKIIDDGSLSSGLCQKMAGGYYFIIEP